MFSRHGPGFCEACHGKQCCGGGNLLCAQRDPHPSVIAGILDSYGGFGVLVAHEDTLHHHVRQGDFLYVVPNKIVHEPIAWGDIPMVCHCADSYLAETIERNGFGNDPERREALHMWWLRQRRHPNCGSVHLPDICYT